MHLPEITIPKLTSRVILLTLGYGVLLLAWLTPEGNAVWVVSILGTGLAYLLANLGVRSRWGGREIAPRVWIPTTIISGALMGLAAALATFFLMLFKNVQHSHFVLDFPNEITLGILERIPQWMVAGLLMHVGLVLAYMAIKPTAKRENQPLTHA